MTFAFLHNKLANDTRQLDIPNHVFANQDIHGTHRSLLRFKYRRKNLQDNMWLNEHVNKTDIKFPKIDGINKREGVFRNLRNTFWNKHFIKIGATVSDTTPAVTAAPTLPITTQADTTPASTNTPTKPITTESITTPIVTEAGQKEVTTEKSEQTQ